jgi:transketolase
MAHPDRTVFCLGSDGSQQEGNDAEAARLAVARNLNVKLLIDDNNVTIAGHPSDYLKGYSVAKTLAGHGLKVVEVDGENIDSLWGGVVEILGHKGPAVVIAKRLMAPGISGIEGSPHGHDVVSVKGAINYLEQRGYSKEVTDVLANISKSSLLPTSNLLNTKQSPRHLQCSMLDLPRRLLLAEQNLVTPWSRYSRN